MSQIIKAVIGIIKGAFRLVAKVGRPLIHIIGLILIAMLVLFWIACIILLFFGQPYASFFLEGSATANFLGTFNILFIIGIPLLMLVLFIMRVFLKSNFRPKWQFGLWAFWLINLVSFSMIGVSTFQDHQYGEEVRVEEESIDFPYDTVRVEMERSPFGNSWHPFGDDALVSDDQLYVRNVRVIFEKSNTGKLEIVQRNEAKGGSLSQAERNAAAVNFSYEIEGNTIKLPAYTILEEGEKFRWQQVFFYVLVPEGMYVERNRRLSRNISWVEQDRDYRFPSKWDADYIWQMGENGMVAPDFIKNRVKKYNLRGFSKIRLDGNIKLKIRRGNRFQITLEEADNQKNVEVVMTDGRLNISTIEDTREDYEMEIIMPNLEELWVLQSNDIEIKDFKLDQLHLVNEGRGHINAFSDVKNLNVELTGDNEFEIRGEGEYLNVILTDDAEMDAEHFTVKNAKIELDNGSFAKISATDTLWRKVMDGEIISRRDPVIIDANESENEEQ
ncbi:MAG: DUF2807 domain-containing protein [Bacteroidota bacterium]